MRGLNDQARRDNVRKVVNIAKSAVVCLQETKLVLISDWNIVAFLGAEYHNFVYLPAQNIGVDILMAWGDGSFSPCNSGGCIAILCPSKFKNRTNPLGGSLECTGLIRTPIN